MTVNHKLFFLPGAGGDPDFWNPLGERLPPAWDKVYLAWPGLGTQESDPRVQSFDDLIVRCEDQMTETSVDLIAQSMGGALALQLALRHPQKINRLVLAVTSGGLDVHAHGAIDWRGDYARAYPNAADWILKPYLNFESQIARITHPTLLLWGDRDPISPVAVGERLRNLLPNAILHVTKGGDHDLARTYAAELAPMVIDHLSPKSTA